MREIRQSGSEGGGTSLRSPYPYPLAPALRRRWALVLAAVVLVLAASAGVAWFVTRHRHPQTQLAERQLTANPPEDWVTGAAISPDGKHIAYHDQTGLYIRSIDSGETHGASLPAELQSRLWDVGWFPDGAKLLVDATSSEGSEFWAITILGEAAPQLLYRHRESPAISPDGQSIAFVGVDSQSGKVRQGVWVSGIGGESPRELIAGKEGQVVFTPAWSPDSHWIAYAREWKTAPGSYSSAIEVRPAGGGPAKTLVSESSLPKSSSLCHITAGTSRCLSWSPDWRLVFSATQAAESPSGHEGYSLWDVPVGPPTGEAAGKPERLAQWSDFGPADLAITADGKRLSFLKARIWADVYWGELSPDGSSMKPPRRFTLDNRGSYFNGWTGDSQAIIFSSARNGKSQVFRQGLKESVGEAVVQGSEDNYNAGPSPDGSWMLYEESAPTTRGAASSPHRLMRRPAAGGSPEAVLEEPAGMAWDYRCPLKPGSACVLRQKEGEDWVFYSLDPVRGKGEQLGEIEAARTGFQGFNVSPDGSRLALVRGEDKYKGRIDVLTFRDRAWYEVSVEPGWGKLQSIAWAAGGKGFFVTSWLPDSFNLLRVTLNGKVQPLVRNAHRQFMFGPMPSPDGKYLAFQAQTWDSNVWMLEGF